MNNDENARNEALNPNQSYIVQAPAGSGKTEILTQRFLVLLAKVKLPEEILALTFTKKSTAEMRHRILTSLKKAQHENEPEATHAKKTWKLAQEVLQNAQRWNWNLFENPNRLRIQTIDSFNSYLTKQLPILSHFGAVPTICNEPESLYQQAVHEFLTHLEENVEWSDAIAILLTHLDNDLVNIVNLLVSLLGKREQWLPYITLNSNEPDLRSKLESTLNLIISEKLAAITKLIPSNEVHELLELARFAASNLGSEHHNIQVHIIACKELTSIPGTKPSDKIQWDGLRELLFTKDGGWRKQVDKRIGFPADKSVSEYKKRILAFIACMSDNSLLQSTFNELSYLPDATYQESQWDILSALHLILKILVAQLKIVFAQHKQIDYIENAHAAFVALGNDEKPTDLTLALDYQIKHILVDEFQDTSNNQYQLLTKLTAEWQTGDGRTLFLVGDPMQSIYRFREAEVGLFIRCKTFGLGQVKLTPLTLTQNFRSSPTIVEWVNKHFATVFPKFNNISTGAVQYTPSSSPNALEVNSIVMLHPIFDAKSTNNEAKQIVNVIIELQKTSATDSIAILVRSRSHLRSVLPLLKTNKIPFRAIDIDPLTSRPFIEDLLALTRALLNPSDRVAWFSILRAPWCGLSLNDLLILGNDKKITVWEQLQSNLVAKLSDEAQIRLHRIIPTLKIKMAERNRGSLKFRIESTWILLGGPACLADQNDLADAKTFFKLLDELDTGGDLANLDNFHQQVSQQFAAADNSSSPTLQIMTIHNSKGLEFDTVILPALDRQAAHDDRPLLLWMERMEVHSSSLLLAPVNAVGEESDPIYNYIKMQHQLKNDYEMSRLLYVAATRAKKNLHLFFNINEMRPSSNSLLEKLWPSIAREVTQINVCENPTIPEAPTQTNVFSLKRLATTWINPISERKSESSFHNQNEGFVFNINTSRLIGTIIHKVLQQIGCQGIEWWSNSSENSHRAYLRNHLLQIGLPKQDLSSSIQIIEKAITNCIVDEKGKWIFAKHIDTQTEFAITTIIDNKPHQLIIDRTFVDEDGFRWIIDYKNTHFSDDLPMFLESEKLKYAKQMRYYHEAMQAHDSRPIKLGLYFPLIPSWIEWTF